MCFRSLPSKVIYLALPLVLFFLTTLDAAAPITHLYFAEKWLEQHPPLDEEAQKEFIVGTLFPDIRYLGGVSRAETHCKGVTLEEVRSTEDPFLAGLLLHSYLDFIRESIAQKMGAYLAVSHLATGQSATYLLKLLEDAWFYSRTNRSFAFSALDEIYEQECKIDGFVRVYAWHILLQNYISSSPKDFLDSSQCSCFYYETAQLWAEHFDDLLQKPELRSYFHSLEFIMLRLIESV